MFEKVDIEIGSKPKSYQIVVGRDLSRKIEDFIENGLSPKPTKIYLITDSHVKQLAKSKKLAQELSRTADVLERVFDCGETTKCIDVLEECLDDLTLKHFSRDDLVVALGGGVIGDVSGLAASLYKRGIRFIQVPTSLLAMVDASIGGKTAINWGYAKNIIGSFWQPTAVFADIDFLDTLEETWWRDGFGEVLKCILLAPRFFKESLKTLQDQLDKDIDPIKTLKSDQELLEKIVLSCIKVKASVVQVDEREENYDGTGILRACLNFGHTLGHAIERVSQFKISHGRAVMLGIVGTLGFGVEEGLVQEDYFRRVQKMARLAFDSKCWDECAKKINILDKNNAKSLLDDTITEAIFSYDKKTTSSEFARIILPGYPPILLGKLELEERFVKPALRSLLAC